MKTQFKPSGRYGKHGKPPYRIPLLYKILIFIGLITVVYFLITYAVIPLLALMTAS